MAPIRVGILGASGYTGSELLRILIFHPDVNLVLVTSESRQGESVKEVHPNLRGLVDLRFEAYRGPQQLKQLDCVFLALPHGESQRLVPDFPAEVRIIDLTGDFRLGDPELYPVHYGYRHQASDLLPQFTYGLPEWNHEELKSARRVANPGCFATAALLGLTPLIQEDLLGSLVVIDAKTGSSGSGATPKAGTHHPERATSFFAYKAFKHQHLPEIRQQLTRWTPNWNGEIVFQAHSAPMVRGIFATLYSRLKPQRTPADIDDALIKAYADRFFVRLVEGSPNVNWVSLTNFADIGWSYGNRTIVVFVGIDNLVKGAAGQAVQNFNLMFGIPETKGLLLPGSRP